MGRDATKDTSAVFYLNPESSNIIALEMPGCAMCIVYIRRECLYVKIRNKDSMFVDAQNIFIAHWEAPSTR